MKKIKLNEVKIVLDSKSENEGLASYICAAFASAFNPTIEEIADIKCTVSEAVTNCVVHAYRGQTGKIYLILRAFDDRSVTIAIKDKGCGISNLEEARQPLFTTDAAGERSGMGFPIMENLSDKFSVTSRPGVGTTVTMNFRFKRDSENV